jgi:hypothetical protein
VGGSAAAIINPQLAPWWWVWDGTPGAHQVATITDKISEIRITLQDFFLFFTGLFSFFKRSEIRKTAKLIPIIWIAQEFFSAFI